jgi:hypothetical protein
VTLLAAFLLMAAAPTATPPAADPGLLARTLTRLERVAELYRDTALGFACQESIAYKGRNVDAGKIQFAYIFIKDESGRLRDFRTWKTGTTAKARGQEVEPVDYHVPRFLSSAYLWAFMFRADRQPLFHFTRLGEEVIGDRTAVRIEFLPRGDVRTGLNDWAGYAWIDRETSQILKVEAYPPDSWNRKQRQGDKAGAFEIERIVTVFGVEKNGMRFPSHVEITKTRFRWVAGSSRDVLRESTLLTVTQDYSRFEFFSVRSSDEIMRFVNGEGPLPVFE